MSNSRRRNSSGELDVFEAALYYSGEVHEANLIGFRRSVAERRSVDAPGRGATELFQRLAKSDCQSKHKGERQPRPGAKLASLIRSFFNQVISKKKADGYRGEKRRIATNARATRPAEAMTVMEGEWSAKAEDDDDGGGSDSSSDLFELENYGNSHVALQRA